jgi:hypothetical protein
MFVPKLSLTAGLVTIVLVAGPGAMVAWRFAATERVESRPRSTAIMVAGETRVDPRATPPKPDPGTLEVREKTIVFTAPNGETFEIQRFGKGFDYEVEMKRMKRPHPRTFRSLEWLDFISNTRCAHPRE